MSRRTPLLIAGFAAGLVGVLAGNSPHPAVRKIVATKPGTTAPTRSKPAVAGPPTGTRSVQGPVEPYGYGQLAVSVTVTGGRITKVTVPTLQTPDSYSQSIAEQAIPMLVQQALQAQSANIQGVSGASYTSEGFAMSLQAALHQLGVA